MRSADSRPALRGTNGCDDNSEQLVGFLVEIIYILSSQHLRSRHHLQPERRLVQLLIDPLDPTPSSPLCTPTSSPPSPILHSPLPFHSPAYAAVTAFPPRQDVQRSIGLPSGFFTSLLAPGLGG